MTTGLKHAKQEEEKKGFSNAIHSNSKKLQFFIKVTMVHDVQKRGAEFKYSKPKRE
jgi:hypothetical protein